MGWRCDFASSVGKGKGGAAEKKGGGERVQGDDGDARGKTQQKSTRDHLNQQPRKIKKGNKKRKLIRATNSPIPNLGVTPKVSKELEAQREVTITQSLTGEVEEEEEGEKCGRGGGELKEEKRKKRTQLRRGERREEKKKLMLKASSQPRRGRKKRKKRKKKGTE